MLKLAQRFRRTRGCIGCLAILLSLSSSQDAAPQREFSAHLLMRMGTEKSGVGVQVHVKQDSVYLDYPDLVHHGRIPFWFLSNGVVASVKAATDKDFNPGPADPLLAGELLRFRPRNPDHFCEEFRAYSIGMMKVIGEGVDDETRKNLQNPDNYPCEQTGQETVAQRECRTYRAVGFPQYWMTISFDPKLATIVRAQINPPQGLILLLDGIKEEPQPASLFVPAADHVVLIDPNKPDPVPSKQ